MKYLLLAASLLVATAHAANNSAFVSQNVPAVMAPGQVYAVSVTLQNTGTTTWTSANLYKLGTRTRRTTRYGPARRAARCPGAWPRGRT